MTTLYSDLYGAPPNPESAGGAQIYRGPTPNYAMTEGGVYVVRGALVIPTGDTLGASDVANLLDAMEGAKLLRMCIVPSADLNAGNDFTFNLGWASDATAFASASTGLQAATAFELSAADLISAAAAAARGDALVLTRVAGALAAGTLDFIAELTHG